MKLLTASIVVLALFLSCITNSPADPHRSFKKEFLERINEARHRGCNCGTEYMPPAPPLVWNDDLETAAQNHAEDMSGRHYFSHTSRDGRTMSDRVIAAGYTYKGFKSFAVGENIAEGQMSIAEVMDGWLKSPGHCKNLMNPSFKEVGVAQFRLYWVQDFGGREPFTKAEQRLIKSGKVKLIQHSSSKE
ncbi:CAP domain-containing protein [Mucilaginibacter ginsenosidivorans]|uniref:CAP domain-containing protein n=1 Tax=Mucilaginibacter ginsenosidivorans TaxID=398053 RepID=A0A5B8V0M3_9SPHI|nr:CAP domain-containing protein [Mucilaginibacter ginsenosidivorans]QEC64595.1 CAP domain-containing protein [Mucilaginibacter ginsenosidivorans]